MAATYKTLTRKYRPQSFEDVVSQEHVSSTLKNAIKQNRLAHAYMFCGPRGVGKTTMARVLARAINHIDASVDGESLSQTLNVVEIDAASNNKVEDVHHLREVVRVPPQSGTYKVFIIDEVHMLSKQAFNALLKTLEEPPPHAIFIFATTEPHKVLPTILSRVQRFDFKRISVDEIVSRLNVICRDEQISIDEESLHTIAKKADGALRDALGLMDQAIAFCGTEITYQELIQALNVVGNDELFEFTRAVAQKDAQAGLLLIDRLLKNGVDIQEFLVSLTTHLRNIYVAKKSSTMHMAEATEDTKTRYREIAQLFEEPDIMRLLHLASEAQLKIRDVQQPRVHFEILMLKMVHMSRSTDLDELLSLVKKNSGSQVNQEKKHAGKPSAQNTTPEPPENTFHPEKQENPENTPAPLKYEKELPVSDKPATPLPSQPSQERNSRGNAGLENFITGKPGLGFLKPVEHEPQDKKNELNKETPPQIPPPALQALSDVEKKWEVVLSYLQKRAPRMLYLQMKDVQLKSLKGSELILSVNNPFAVNIVEENKNLIGTICKETYGVFIRLKCVVEREKKEEAKSLSPFDRFMELQKKDPALKTIVELFGAEIEYR